MLVFAVDRGSLTDPEPAATVSMAIEDIAAQPDVLGIGDLQRSAD